MSVRKKQTKKTINLKKNPTKKTKKIFKKKKYIPIPFDLIKFIHEKSNSSSSNEYSSYNEQNNNQTTLIENICKPAISLHTLAHNIPIEYHNKLVYENPITWTVDYDKTTFYRAEQSKFFVFMHGGAIIENPLFTIPNNIILIHPVRDGKLGLLGGNTVQSYIETYNQTNFIKLLVESKSKSKLKSTTLNLNNSTKIYMPGDVYYDTYLSFDHGGSDNCCIKNVNKGIIEEMIGLIPELLAIKQSNKYITLKILLEMISEVIDKPVIIVLNSCNSNIGLSDEVKLIRNTIDTNGNDRLKEIYDDIKDTRQTRSFNKTKLPKNIYGSEIRCRNTFEMYIKDKIDKELRLDSDLEMMYLTLSLSKKYPNKPCCIIYYDPRIISGYTKHTHVTKRLNVDYLNRGKINNLLLQKRLVNIKIKHMFNNKITNHTIKSNRLVRIINLRKIAKKSKKSQHKPTPYIQSSPLSSTSSLSSLSSPESAFSPHGTASAFPPHGTESAFSPHGTASAFPPHETASAFPPHASAFPPHGTASAFPPHKTASAFPPSSVSAFPPSSVSAFTPHASAFPQSSAFPPSSVFPPS